MKAKTAIVWLLAAGCLCAVGCDSDKQDASRGDPREGEADRLVRQKWQKSLAELPTVTLSIISPHNTEIENEFESAFSLHHAVQFGRKVDIEWRDVGGGGTSILQYLRNVYARKNTSGIDMVWGGGDFNFRKMADEDLLQPMTLGDDVRRNIPETFCGLAMYDQQGRWCGSAISGFGFLYNADLLKRLGRRPPVLWDDLGAPRFHGLIGLADPTKSGSAAAAYGMIVQSAPNWPDGWAKLLGILGNTKKFYDGASDAAEAPVSGETAVAACIDFYGATRVSKYPEILAYVSPEGQTAFNPDPIAILKNPPHPELAQRFADFVLSRRGQALWALRVGETDGPYRTALGRQPIRRDVYEAYAGKLSPWVINPYQAGRSMKLDTQLWNESFEVLRQLVSTAAVKNAGLLAAAKKKLIESNFDAELVAEFNRLPDNVARPEQLAEISRRLRDKKDADILITDWTTFFREKYRRIIQ